VLAAIFPSLSISADHVSIEKIHLDKNPYRMTITFSGEPSYKVIQSDDNEVLIAFRNSKISRQLKTSGDARPFIASISLERAAGDIVSFVINTKTKLTSVRPRWDQSKNMLVISLNEPPSTTRNTREKKEDVAKKVAPGQPKAEKQDEAVMAAKPERTKFNGVMDDLILELKDDACGKNEVLSGAIDDCEKKLFKRSFEMLSKYLSEEPGETCHEQALILKAYSYYKSITEENESGMYLDAAEHFQDLISYYPDSRYVPYALTGLGKVNLALKNKAEAKGYFKVVHSTYQDYNGMPEVMMALGKIYNETEQSKQAIAIFKEAVKRFPYSSVLTDIRIELGKALYNAKNYIEAISVLSEVIKTNAKIIYEKPDILVFLGNSYFNTGKTKETREYLGMVYNLFPNTELNHEYLTKIGDTYRDENDTEKALEIYRLVIEKYPGTSGFVLSTMRLADLSKDSKEKEKMYQLIIDDFPDHSVYRLAIMRLAELYDKNGEYLKGIAVIKRLLDEGAGILRKDALALLEKTTISLFKDYLNSDKSTDLLAHFEADKAILNRFKNPEFFWLVGNGYYKAYLLEPAFEFMKKSYDLYEKGKQPPELIMNLAVTMQEKGMRKEALDMFDQYIARFKNSQSLSKAYYRKGLIYSSMNTHDKAIENFRQAFEKSENNEEKVRILVGEANVHKAIENYKIVSILLEKAIQILASGPYDDFNTIFLIHRNLGENYMKLEEYVKASDAFKMALKFSDKQKNNADVTFMLGDSYQKADALLKAAEAFEAVIKSGDTFWGRLADERLREIKVENNLQKS